MDLKSLTRLEKVFLKLIETVAKGRITSIYVDAYDNGTRKATIHWNKGDDVKRISRFTKKILTIKAKEKLDDKRNCDKAG